MEEVASPSLFLLRVYFWGNRKASLISNASGLATWYEALASLQRALFISWFTLNVLSTTHDTALFLIIQGLITLPRFLLNTIFHTYHILPRLLTSDQKSTISIYSFQILFPPNSPISVCFSSVLFSVFSMDFLKVKLIALNMLCSHGSSWWRIILVSHQFI